MEKNKEAWDHACAAASEFRKSVASMLPPEVAQHGRAAQKEVLLAVRSLIDGALERIEKKSAPDSPSPAGQQ
jgi:hypothetical protein